MGFVNILEGYRQYGVKNLAYASSSSVCRDFTYVDNIADGLTKVIDNPAKVNPDWDVENLTPDRFSVPYRICNIGNNAPISLMEFIKTIENALGKVAKKNMLPMQDSDVVSIYANTSALIHDFNYKPDTKLADGINAFVIWYKKFYR